MIKFNKPILAGTLTQDYFAILVSLTFVVVMGFGMWQVGATLQHLTDLDFPKSWSAFRAGRTTSLLEKQLDQNLPMRAVLIGAANSARYLLTGGAGDQVRLGQQQYLFLVDELKFEPQGTAHLDMRVQLLAEAARALKAQHVQLVVALVPDKARVYRKFLPDGRYPSYNETRYSSALDALRLQAVDTVNLLEPLQQASLKRDVYYRTDTHWNQAGAQVAAEQIARHVKTLQLGLEQTEFKTAPSGPEVERAGDLIHLMGLDDMPNALRPQPDIEIPVHTQQTESDPATGLFGDASVPVALIGTSYSLRGNFNGFLQQALATKILNTAKDGGGLLDAATAYLADDSFRQTKPKLAIWEIPERFLYAPLDKESTWLAKVGLKP